MASEGLLQDMEDRDRAVKLDRMATSLMEWFGDRALEVSERQISMGNVRSVSEVWQEISDTIRRRDAAHHQGR